jgi:hypothetical protein
MSSLLLWLMVEVNGGGGGCISVHAAGVLHQRIYNSTAAVGMGFAHMQMGQGSVVLGNARAQRCRLGDRHV